MTRLFPYRRITLPTVTNRATWSVEPIPPDVDSAEAAFAAAAACVSHKTVCQSNTYTNLLISQALGYYADNGLEVIPQISREDLPTPTTLSDQMSLVIEAFGCKRVNLMIEVSAAGWLDKWSKNLRHSYEVLKSQYPLVTMAISISYEAVNRGKGIAQLASSIAEISYADAIGITTYPQLQGLETPTDHRRNIPETYYDPAIREIEKTRKPIWILESGWHTRYSTQAQADFVAVLGGLQRKYPVALVNYYFLYDPNNIPWPIEYFNDMGLLDSDGNAKPAYSVFRQFALNG